MNTHLTRKDVTNGTKSRIKPSNIIPSTLTKDPPSLLKAISAVKERKSIYHYFNTRCTKETIGNRFHFY
jgi:hypothetical protein